MSTANYEPPELQTAYIHIAEFFDTYALADALAYTKRVLRVAGNAGYWKSNPSNPLFFLEKMETLVMAVLTIHRSGEHRPAAVVALAEDESPSVTAYEQYCGWHHKRSPWWFFPRHLSPKQYADPYRVFALAARWGSRKAWKGVLRTLEYHALSTSPLSEFDEGYDTLELYLLLCKLVEAAHLIEVGAINEIGGEPRNKWKGLPDDVIKVPST